MEERPFYTCSTASGNRAFSPLAPSTPFHSIPLTLCSETTLCLWNLRTQESFSHVQVRPPDPREYVVYVRWSFDGETAGGRPPTVVSSYHQVRQGDDELPENFVDSILARLPYGPCVRCLSLITAIICTRSSYCLMLES